MKVKKCLLAAFSFAFIISVVAFIFSICSTEIAVADAADETIQSFEDGVPQYWTSDSGALSVTEKRYKLGSKSLMWNVGTNDFITVTDEKNMSALEGRNIRAGGFVIWIYSEAERSGEMLCFRLGDRNHSENGLSFSFTFNMNFKGWRTLWVRLYEDAECSTQDRRKFNSGEWQINTMTVTTSRGLRNKNIFFDALQFSEKIFWNRASDWQFDHEDRVDDGSEEISNWSGAYLYSKRTPSVPLRSVTEKDRDSLEKIERRLTDWMLGTDDYIKLSENPRFNALQKNVKNAKAKYDALNIKNSGGAWTGTPLFCSNSPFANQGAVFTRGYAETIFLPFALDYKINGNKDSLQHLFTLLDYWNDQGWAYGSGIGSLDHETLRASGYFPAVYLIKDELRATGRFERERKTVEWYSEFGKVYGNSSGVYEQTTADEMRTHFLNRLIYVFLLDGEAERVQAMESYVQWINGALQINPNRGDTIKPDYTGFHHNNVYMSTYPPHGYHMASMINYILRGTTFAMGREAQSNLKQALVVHDVLLNTLNVPLQVKGRFPNDNDVGQQILPAYAYMALAGNPETGEDFDTEMAAIFMRRWNAIGAKRQYAVRGYGIGGISYINSYGALNVIYELLAKNAAPAETPHGFRSLPYAGMAVARQDEWLLAVRGFSKYLWDFESGTGENVYGLYSSYGMINTLSASAEEDGVNIVSDASSGFDYQNGWDWNRFAGTTSVNLPLDVLGGASMRNYNDSAFLGATGLNGNGVWGFELKTGGFTYKGKNYNQDFTAKKSVFVFGNEIVALGSDISNGDTERRTETTLFQNSIKDGGLPITVNGASVDAFPYEFKGSANSSCWLTDPYGNGYYLPDASGLNVARSTQNSIAPNGKTKSTGNYATAWIDHGSSPSSAGYEYAVLVNTDNRHMEEYAADKPYMVLKKDCSAHVVYKAGINALAYAIFSADAELPSNGIIKNTDTPILSYTQANGNKTQIAISDPDLRIGAQDESVMQNSVMKTARITLSGNQTLSGVASGVKVVESGKDFTVLEIACRDGKTVEFEVTGAGEAKPAHGLTVSGGKGSGVYRAGDVVAIECDVPEGKVSSHWIAEGIALSEEQLSSPKLTFTMPDSEVKLTAAFADSVSGNSTSDTVILIVCLACTLLALAAIAVRVCLYLKRKRSKP